ncbi:MAG: hypothetical protein QNJ46_18175 [Leptolyngbyaceae cyanobacterium MO_188.B28]|nr:hypothetical protein [Leptolyngbyaceae cyanobacterium MO_188.B28]
MKSPALLVASFLALLVNPHQTAKASDLGLDFSLLPANGPASPTQPKTQAKPRLSAPDPAPKPLPIPTAAAHPPITASSLPSPPTVYRAVYQGAPNEGNTAATLVKRAVIPPPPPLPDPVLPPKTAAASIPQSTPLSLDFDLDRSPIAQTTALPKRLGKTADPAQALPAPNRLFKGGTDSLVAKAIGSAEGTRTPDGHRTAAYYGHVDPGNRAWNLGTFSYQHGATSPEDADEKQLKRLQRQTQHLDQKANIQGLTLTLEEKLNAIDLANQAPLAALGRGGYIEWLSEAHRLGMSGSEAILWARTRSFLDPDTQRWNAPGLGNTVASISQDQERRMMAISRAMNRHQRQPEPVMADTSPPSSPTLSRPMIQTAAAKPPQPKREAADLIFSVALQPAEIAQKIPAPASPQISSRLTQETSSPPTAAAPPNTPHPAVPSPSSRPALIQRDQPTQINDIPLKFTSFAPNPTAENQSVASPIS